MAYAYFYCFENAPNRTSIFMTKFIFCDMYYWIVFCFSPISKARLIEELYTYDCIKKTKQAQRRAAADRFRHKS